jgi:phage/plasmid primase-like uncharacterized protein
MIGALSARELAAQFGLHRAEHEWRGACPACGYVDAFVLTDGKHGPIGWCASCQDRDAIAAALGGGQQNGGASLQREPSADDTQKRIARAEKIWRSREPLLDTAASAYLDARGIGHLVHCVDLGFSTSCRHPSGRFERPVHLPALLAAVRDVDGTFIGIHRTFLKHDGSGKADVEPQRASLGPVRGGAIQLVPLAEVLAAGELVIGEGIETSASAGLLLGLPAWAAVSAGNLAVGVALPAEIRRVVIAADRDLPDAEGRTPGQRAAQAAWWRLRRQGRVVRIVMPDDAGADFNDIVGGGADG